jgi:hypothetical protein
MKKLLFFVAGVSLAVSVNAQTLYVPGQLITQKLK